MNENINLIKILENCPEGFSLYSIIYGNVTFLRIINNVIQFMYSYNTSYGPFTCAACVNLEGKPSGSYNGECTLFPSKEQRDWNKFIAPWLKKEKFNPKTLQPFDKVLAKVLGSYIWKVDFYSHNIEGWKFPYICVGNIYKYCIPYNDDTKHLVGTTDEAPEYYRYWKN